MMNPSKKSRSDNSFSSFAIGVSVGVAASLLFGTEEGRKLVKKVVDSVPEKYKKMPESPRPSLDIPLQETPHHSTYMEAPPPPAPHVRPSRPEPFIP